MRILVQVFSFLIFLSFATNVHAQEHVSLLKKSVPEWNKWRKQNPGIIPNFRGVDLIKANLQGANLREAQLQEANLIDANLQDAYLQDAYLGRAKLERVNLRFANLRRAVLPDTNLRGAYLGGVKLERAYLRLTNLQDAILVDANLQGANLRGVKNLTCEQINSLRSLDKRTKFPDYIMVKITGKNKWTCKEIKMKNDKQE